MTAKLGIGIASIQVRYRLTDSKDHWHYISGISPDSPNVDLGRHFEKNKDYSVQARAWSDCGIASDWSAEQILTVVPGADLPATVTAIASQPLPLSIQFKLTLSGTGKLPAGAHIEVHTAPDVAGSPGAFSDTGLKPESLTFIVGAPTNLPVWYMFRVVDGRGNIGAFSTQVKVTSTQITDVVGGTGNNLMDPLYAIIGSGKLPLYAAHPDWDIGRAATISAYGYKDLQLTSNSAASNPQLACTASTVINTKRGWMQLSNKIYGVQVKMVNVDGDANALNLQHRFDNAAGAASAGVTAARVGGGSGNGVYAADLDLTSASDTLVYLRHLWNGPVAVGKRVDMQGWAVFEKQGTSAVVPDFTAPGTPTAGDIQDDPDNSGRAITTVGTAANRPAAGNAGTLYLSTDAGTNGQHHYDNGAAWVKVGVGHLGDADGSLDNVGDGATYGKVILTRLSAGKPFVDLSESINLNRTLQYIGDYGAGNRFAVAAVDGAGKALIDFSQSGHSNKTLDNIGDGSTYGRVVLTRLSSGKPFVDLSESINLNRSLQYISDYGAGNRFAVAAVDGAGKALIDFSQSGHSNKTVDNIGDGSTYGRVKLAALTSGQVDLSLAGVTNKTLQYVTDYAAGGRYAAGEAGADVTSAHTAGAAANLCRLVYSLFNVNGLQPNLSTSNITLGVSGTSVYGFPALQLAFSGTAAGYVSLRQASNETTAHLRKKKYLVSAYVGKGTSNNNAYAFHFSFMNGGGVPTDVADTATVTASSDHAANTDGVYFGVLDLTGVSTLDGFLRVVWDANPSAGNGFIQGVQIEEMVGNVTAPSAYEAPTDWGLFDYSGATQQPSGSTPAIIPDMNFSYTRNTTSINITWSSFTIRRPDATTTSVSSGNQNVTGLSSGTTYGFYPFYDEMNQDVEFCQRSAGSPAIMSTTVSSGIIASAQTRLGRIPLSISACSVATTSSGTSSGTGGGISNCLHPDQVLLVTRDGEEQLIRSIECREGDELWTGKRWAAVKRAWTDRHEEFVVITFHTGETLMVTPSEPVYHPDGEFTRAKALRLDDVLDGAMHPLEVREVRKLLQNGGVKVCIDLDDDDRTFYVTPTGPKVHNTVYKP